ncbi:Disease resistance protein [Melia azedarach]|uniref:Disease resistance protein n=1 Tax=Melia azedarach TaxID=155640 RepID=A0ACC1Y0C6_MELAZ|nr:Disease resistance protein [Melia azedarach]
MGVPELIDFPEGFQHLVSLKYLNLHGQPNADNHTGSFKLAALPESLQHIPPLEVLGISGFPNLTSLPSWLGNLTSLQFLSIIRCCKLCHLPMSTKNHSNLQTLFISPELLKRCEKEIGEDWHKIAHISFVKSVHLSG